MRERLTLSFAVVTLLLIGAAFVGRSFLISHQLRSHTTDELRREAQVAAVAIDERSSTGKPVDQSFLQSMVGTQVAMTYHVPGGESITVRGEGFNDRIEEPTSANVWAASDAGDGTLVLLLDNDAIDGVAVPSVMKIVLLFLMLAVVAALVGFVMARWLSAPFRQLAGAAAALGRGRFQLDLPSSRMREVRAISTALSTSSEELQARLGREQQFAEHASHVLRTPLTALRLELEDLRLHDDLPSHVAAAIDRSVWRIDQLDGVTGDLVALSRRNSLSHGVQISLQDLATSSVQRWADELGLHDRAVTAAVEGDLTTTYTPGPVEQILDLLLLEVLRRSRGEVRVEFEASADEHLRIMVAWASQAQRKGRDDNSALMRARAVAMALGGRLEDDEDWLLVRLPRR
jgi:signal transduction histidine kinase